MEIQISERQQVNYRLQGLAVRMSRFFVASLRLEDRNFVISGHGEAGVYHLVQGVMGIP